MKQLLLISLFLLSNVSFAELSCSANGLNVLYINGIYVPKMEDAKKSATTIKNINDLIHASLDQNKVFDVELVHNASRSFLNDMEETSAQLAADHSGKSRLEYWKKFALHNIKGFENSPDRVKIEEALAQITSGKDVVNRVKYNQDGSVEQDSYTPIDHLKDMIQYDNAVFQMLANATSDIGVVEQLKIKIKEAYHGGANKLIVVAHSQGNEVLNSAIKDLRNDPTFLATPYDVKKFDGLVGYLQVAPPSPILVTNTFENVSAYAGQDSNHLDHAQYIRHNRDGVIGMSGALTGVTPIPSNYVAEVGIPPEGLPTLAAEISHFLDNFFNTFGNKGIFTLYHGMDEVYLSSTYKATRNSTGVNQALVDHFKDNMREIASKLQDNCDSPDIDITVPGALRNAITPTTFDYQSATNYYNNISITAKDKNDPDNSTIFKFIYNVFVSSRYFYCNGCGGLPDSFFDIKTAEGETSISDFSIPFSDRNYVVSVTATNKFGKVSQRSFTIATKHDQPPKAVVTYKSCSSGPIAWDRDGSLYYMNTGDYMVMILATDTDSEWVHVSEGGDVLARVRPGTIQDINMFYSGSGDSVLYFYSSLEGERFPLSIPGCDTTTKFYTGERAW
ncbi:MAG: hypothetical protein PHY93_16655 [Bacteriovorax sp.]|nr:hypothetical protein [Bacteriovorax sp.]